MTEIIRCVTPVDGRIYAEREAQGVEDDRLPCPCLARQRCKARTNGKVQRLDQHNVPDGKRGQHRGPALARNAEQGYPFCSAAAAYCGCCTDPGCGVAPGPATASQPVTR